MAPLHVIFAEMEGKLKTIQYSLQLTLHFHLLKQMRPPLRPPLHLDQQLRGGRQPAVVPALPVDAGCHGDQWRHAGGAGAVAHGGQAAAHGGGIRPPRHWRPGARQHPCSSAGDLVGSCTGYPFN